MHRGGRQPPAQTRLYRVKAMDLLKYKDYEGTAELDMTRRVCRGRILFIDDVVTYEAASPEFLQQEFEAAVDDYLQTCVRVGKEPQRPFRGLFNVRVPAPLHRSAALRATRDGISLNEVVVSALTSYLQASPVVGDGKTADAARR